MKLSLHKNKSLSPTVVRYMRAHTGMNAHHAWDRLLAVFVVLLAVLILFTLFLFHRILDNSLFNPETTGSQSVAPIERVKLEAVLKRFDEREALRATILTTPPTVVDPSVKR